MNDTFMKTKPVFPLLVSMALPNVISMLVNSLYNIVDSLFVAQINEQAMTALSLVFPIQNFVSAVAIGFGIGINALVALYRGAGDHDRADAAATHGMALSVLHGILCTLAATAIMPGFLARFTADGTIVSMGVTYSTIVFLFATVNMASLAFEKIFQAVGRMKLTMIASSRAVSATSCWTPSSSLASARCLPWALQARRWLPASDRPPLSSSTSWSTAPPSRPSICAGRPCSPTSLSKAVSTPSVCLPS